MTDHQVDPDNSKRPIPQTLSVQQVALEAVMQSRAAALYMQTAAEKLERIFEAVMTPPETRPIALSAATPNVTDRSRWECRSIGVYNPSAVTICIGIGGASATFAGRVPSCPPNSMIVLPLHDYDIELGIDPSQIAALAGGTAIVTLFRFNAVQPFFAAKIA